MSQIQTPEFDAYAAEYLAGMENPVKRLMGSDAAQFITPKVRWMLRDLARRPPNGSTDVRLLDFGCGAGLFLRELRRLGHTGSIEGCDVSAGMLRAAEQSWDRGPLPPLRHHAAGGPAPYPDGEFDVLVVSAVLHHVAPEDRPCVCADIWRLLRPGGRVYIFEHNPWNPLTRWVIQRTPIDRHAILLSSSEATAVFTQHGARHTRVEYLLFTPPRLRLLSGLDHLLRRCPFGAQYVLACEKP